MGYAGYAPPDPNESMKLRLTRLRFSADGCYSLPDSTYWGSPPNVWYARSEDAVDADGRPAEITLRADDRSEAKEKILAKYPNARFFR